MSIMNKALPSSFKLVFPVLPESEDLAEQNKFNIHLTETVLPSLTINPVKVSYKGTDTFSDGGGVNFGKWNTKIFIDEKWENYSLIYDWMESIHNGIDFFGRKDFAYQINANLIILDNYEEPTLEFVFGNIWPTTLGEVKLSYQEDKRYLLTDITFAYDYFYKK